ncbi:MAG: DUF58 domain-containing protein, partial [Dehalococcoidia bacterium]|nr:DUF58 domain-containing protein [Dehalococcoidia bacterium]
VILLAVATGEGVLHRLSYFLVLGLAGSYVRARLSLWRLDMWVEKQASVAQVGEMLEGFIYVRNNSPVPTGWVEVMQLSDMHGDVCGGATRLPAWGSEAWNAQRFCYARGVYSIGPLVARSGDILGLFRVQITRGDLIPVVIYPPTVELPYFRLPAADLSGEEKVRHGSEIRSSQVGTVREYAYGDSLNRIHWPSTAKYDQLMSKEFDSGRSSEVWVVLDLERRIHRSEGMERTDEYAVAIAASLARLALAEKGSVGLITYGDQEYLLPLGSGTRQMSRVLEMLAWSKTEGDIPLAEVLARNTMKLDRFASLLIVTSSTTTEWVSVLQNLMYHGLSIAVVLVDPTSFGGDPSCYEVVMRLLSAGIPAYVVRRGDSLPIALSRPMTLHDLPIFEQRSTPELIPGSEA